MDLDPLREKALAAMTATTAQDGATAFGLHAGTEAELAFARALGRLVGALHIRKSVNNWVGKDVWKGWGCQWINWELFIFREIILPVIRNHPNFCPPPRNPSGYRGESLGVIAQLVERLNGIEEVWGSNPHGSTKRLAF